MSYVSNLFCCHGAMSPEYPTGDKEHTKRITLCESDPSQSHLTSVRSKGSKVSELSTLKLGTKSPGKPSCISGVSRNSRRNEMEKKIIKMIKQKKTRRNPPSNPFGIFKGVFFFFLAWSGSIGVAVLRLILHVLIFHTEYKVRSTPHLSCLYSELFIEKINQGQTSGFSRGPPYNSCGKTSRKPRGFRKALNTSYTSEANRSHNFSRFTSRGLCWFSPLV